jgi:hypothetical protein
MPNALVSGLSIFQDIEGDSSLEGVDTWWLYKQPLSLIWADNIFVPCRHACSGQTFDIKVGFDRSDEAISESTSYAWNRLIKADVIKAVPVTERARKLVSWAYNETQRRVSEIKAERKGAVAFHKIKGFEYCVNHLDAVAANSMLSYCTDSIWLSDEREAAGSEWFISGGLNQTMKKLPVAKAAVGRLNELVLPNFEIIPPVAGCANCGSSGAHCYTSDYGPKNWVSGSMRRLEQLLEIRDSDEARALRKVLNQIISVVARAQVESEMKVEAEVRKELIEAFKRARKRMEQDLRALEKMAGIVALFSLIPQWVSEFEESKAMSLLGLSLATTSCAGVEVYRNLVCKRSAWINIKQNIIAAENPLG